MQEYYRLLLKFQRPQYDNAAARRPNNPGLSAPDLQLDWFTDSSDDDVQVLNEENNQVSSSLSISSHIIMNGFEIFIENLLLTYKLML